MTLDRQPTLRGATLLARPTRADDLEPLYAVASDPLLWAQHPSPDRWRREQFEPFFADGLQSGGGLTVQRLADGAVVGSSRFAVRDSDSGSGESRVEIGWTYLDRSLWGGPANRELKGLMLGHAFGSVDRVVFRIGPDNLRSRRAVEKLGARLIGSEPHPGGRDPIDWVVYELARGDWAA